MKLHPFCARPPPEGGKLCSYISSKGKFFKKLNSRDGLSIDIKAKSPSDFDLCVAPVSLRRPRSFMTLSLDVFTDNHDVLVSTIPTLARGVILIRFLLQLLFNSDHLINAPEFLTYRYWSDVLWSIPERRGGLRTAKTTTNREAWCL